MRQNRELEKIVVGGLLPMDAEERIEIVQSLSEKDFVSEKLQGLFRYIAENIDHDMIAIYGNFQALGFKSQSEISELAYPISINSLKTSVRELKEITAQRKFELLAKAIERKLKDNIDSNELINLVDEELQNIAENQSVDTGNLRSIYQSLLEKRSKDNSIKTGIEGLDNKLDGMGNGELWVVGGRSGGGKSMFITDLTAKWVANGYKGLFFSTELSSEAELSFMAKPYSEYIKTTIEEAEKGLSENPNIKIFSQVKTIEKILAKVKQYQLKKAVDFFVIDHLQDLEYPENIEQYIALSRAIQKIKSFCVSTGARCICASQLSRSGQNEKDQLAYSFLGSGKIEQVCDSAMILVREKSQDKTNYTNSTVLIIQKNRKNGRLGYIYLDGHPISRTFREVEVF